MKALVYSAPNMMDYQDVAEPAPAAGELLVRVEAAGICGSDMHAFHGHDARRVPPMVLGHEAAGVVVDGARAGERVALNPLITCGDCFYCRHGRSNLCANRKMLGMSRQGAMAEMVTIPAEFALSLSAEISQTHAALMEPTACAWHALQLIERVALRPLAESNILIIGAGAIGLLSALLLHHEGCRTLHLADTNQLRRDSAKTINIATVHDPRKRPYSAEFDIVIDAVGSATTRQTGMQSVRPAGVIMHIGLQEASGDFDARKLTLDEVSFLGTYTYKPADLQHALDALSSGALGDLAWVEARPLADGAQAFAELDAGQAAAAKIVLLP